MSEKKPNDLEVVEDLDVEADDPVYRIRVEKHLWPDQLEMKRLKTENKKLKHVGVVLLLVLLAAGYLVGNFFPIPLFAQFRRLDANDKFNEVMNIMENDWYFSKEIENEKTRLLDQALVGITTNEEDPHTDYMSKEQIASFAQSINRNFVGLGIVYTVQDGTEPIVRSVVRNSPAEEAGVLAGDIIAAVGEQSVSGLSSEEIADLCKGEVGSKVDLSLVRDGKELTLTLTYREVSNTVSGEIREGNIGYVQLAQFGDTTAEELDAYLKDFCAAEVTHLVVDLRDNGGGYLGDLQKVASLFLEKGTVIMQEELTDGSSTNIVANGTPYTNFHGIAILINSGTASAAEVFALAMQEQRADVTLVGTTSYGKGTVQTTRYFSDGSALKYTQGRWLSPNGIWVNQVGIEPDVEVENHEILHTSLSVMDEGDTYTVDQVSEFVKVAQLCLDYLEREPDRTDGYFSEKTEELIRQFQAEKDLEQTGTLNVETYQALLSSVVRDWTTSTKHDLQYNKAVEVIQ